MHAKNGNDDLRHDLCTFKLTLTDLNDIPPNSSNHELTLCIRFDKIDRKIYFRSISISFSDSFATKLLGSFVAKTSFPQYKMLRKFVKLA